MQSKIEDFQQFTEAQTKHFKLRKSPLEDTRGPPVSPTSMRLSTGKMRCQGGNKRTKVRSSTAARFRGVMEGLEISN